MVTTQPQIVRVHCGICGDFLGSTDGTYFEGRPCKSCGSVTEVQIGKRAALTSQARNRTISETTT